MNKILVVSIAALFTLMVFVGESQQQSSTFPPPVVYEGCTCVGKPERPESEENVAGRFGDRRGPRHGGRGGRRDHPQPDLSLLPAAFSDTEANTVKRFFCACPN